MQKYKVWTERHLSNHHGSPSPNKGQYIWDCIKSNKRSKENFTPNNKILPEKYHSVLLYCHLFQEKEKCKRIPNCPLTKCESCVQGSPQQQLQIQPWSHCQPCSSEFLLCTGPCAASWQGGVPTAESRCAHRQRHTTTKAAMKTGLLSPAQQQQNSSPLPPCHLPHRCLFCITTKTVSLWRTNSKYLDSTSAGDLKSEACTE